MTHTIFASIQCEYPYVNRELLRDAVSEAEARTYTSGIPNEVTSCTHRMRAWKITAASNVLSHMLRYERRKAPLEGNTDLHTTGNEEEIILIKLSVDSALEYLSEKQLEVIQMKYYDGLTISEIAYVLNISKDAVTYD